MRIADLPSDTSTATTPNGHVSDERLLSRRERQRAKLSLEEQQDWDLCGRMDEIRRHLKETILGQRKRDELAAELGRLQQEHAAAHPEQTDQYIEALTEEKYAEKKAARAADAKLAAEKQALRQVPGFLPVTELPRSKTRYRVDKIWPARGTVLLSAYQKVGKSTLLRNLFKALLSGESFLGEFNTRSVTDHIVVADFEMPDSIVLERLDAHGLGESKRLRYEFLRGRGQDFNVLDEGWREKLAKALRDAECEILVIDTINALAGALGINMDSSSEMAPLLAALEELKLDAGVDEMLLTAQTGHADRSRAAHSKDLGASADMLWSLQLVKDSDPAGPRKFSAYGRAEGTDHPLTLTFDRETDKVTADKATQPVNAKTKILVVMTGGTEMSTNEIEEQSGYKRAMVNRMLDELAEEGSVIMTREPKGNKPATWRLA